MSDYHDPLAVMFPCQFQSQNDYPTEIVANRFQAWRTIIKDIVVYFKQYALVQEEILRQQARLQQAVGSSAASSAPHVSIIKSSHGHKDKDSLKDDTVNDFFLPQGNGSIQDLPSILTKFHQLKIENGLKTLKELTQVIIPRLEDLRKDLLVKIKEIKNLQNDFKNSLPKEINESKSLLSQFNHAIDITNRLEILTSSGNSIPHDNTSVMESSKRDPYLVKLLLDRQLRRQLSEEHYLYDAFKNLQASSEKLESIVVMEIQNYFRLFLNLVQNEHAAISDVLVPNITQGFLLKEPTFEWESFIDRNLPKTSSISRSLTSGKFIDLSYPARRLSDLNIPHYDLLVNVPVREGSLERRSKFLKSYSSGWYVLTCSYLHEFKTSDRKKEQVPVMSLSLDQCLVSQHTKSDNKLSGSFKFVLYSKQQNGIIHRGHNWVFKCNSYQDMIDWYNDIKQLTSLASPSARAKSMSKVLSTKKAAIAEKKLSRTSSVLSGNTGADVRSQGTLQSRDRLMRLPTNLSMRSKQASQNLSVASTGQNKRLSSTFSQKNYQQSPKLSNLINSDGTIVTPVDTRQDEYVKENEREDGGVNPLHGLSLDQNEFHTPSQMPQGPIQIAGYTPQGTPQHLLSQNYGYYNSQHPQSQQPQQFYDPVSQLFTWAFPVQADAPYQIPQQQGPIHSGNTPQLAQTQPMPQYFPQSPQANPPKQYFPASPNLQPQIVQTAATPNAESTAGQRLHHLQAPQFALQQPYSDSNGPGFLPYPVQMGERLPQTRQNSTVSRSSKGEVSENQNQNHDVSRDERLEQEDAVQATTNHDIGERTDENISAHD